MQRMLSRAMHDDLLPALRRCLAADEPAEPRLIETHLSWVLLTAQHAWKLKKPVNLGFVDYSTAEARHHACLEELRVNRRMAPVLYLEVLPVTGTPGGEVELGGTGEVLDWVVRMRRFADGALWSERVAAGTLLPRHIDQFAARLAALHESAPRASVSSGWGGARVVAESVQRVHAQIEALCPGAIGPMLGPWLADQAITLAPLWGARLALGKVRECHGDLHLANVVMLGDGVGEEEAAAFDAIEFDPALRWIDVLSDTAFLMMDLWAHGRRDLAFRLLNAYLEHTGDYAGLPVLRHYLVYRALVRGMVGLLRGERPQDSLYLPLAATIAGLHDPRLLLTCGLPGSGKTWVTQRLLEATGAVRLRSDVERKRLHGLTALADSRAGGRDIYTADTTALTYRALGELARIALHCGCPVIVDAASLRRSERRAIELVARDIGAPFLLLHCTAPMAVLRQRVQARYAQGEDASEADLAVLEYLGAVAEAPAGDELARTVTVDTSTFNTDDPDALDAVARRWRESAPAAPG